MLPLTGPRKEGVETSTAKVKRKNSADRGGQAAWQRPQRAAHSRVVAQEPLVLGIREGRIDDRTTEHDAFQAAAISKLEELTRSGPVVVKDQRANRPRQRYIEYPEPEPALEVDIEEQGLEVKIEMLERQLHDLQRSRRQQAQQMRPRYADYPERRQPVYLRGPPPRYAEPSIYSGTPQPAVARGKRPMYQEAAPVYAGARQNPADPPTRRGGAPLMNGNAPGESAVALPVPVVLAEAAQYVFIDISSDELRPRGVRRRKRQPQGTAAKRGAPEMGPREMGPRVITPSRLEGLRPLRTMMVREEEPVQRYKYIDPRADELRGTFTSPVVSEQQLLYDEPGAQHWAPGYLKRQAQERQEAQQAERARYREQGHKRQRQLSSYSAEEAAESELQAARAPMGERAEPAPEGPTHIDITRRPAAEVTQMEATYMYALKRVYRYPEPEAEPQAEQYVAPAEEERPAQVYRVEYRPAERGPPEQPGKRYVAEERAVAEPRFPGSDSYGEFPREGAVLYHYGPERGYAYGPEPAYEEESYEEARKRIMDAQRPQQQAVYAGAAETRDGRDVTYEYEYEYEYVPQRSMEAEQAQRRPHQAQRAQQPCTWGIPGGQVDYQPPAGVAERQPGVVAEAIEVDMVYEHAEPAEGGLREERLESPVDFERRADLLTRRLSDRRGDIFQDELAQITGRQPGVLEEAVEVDIVYEREERSGQGILYEDGALEQARAREPAEPDKGGRYSETHGKLHVEYESPEQAQQAKAAEQRRREQAAGGEASESGKYTETHGKLKAEYETPPSMPSGPSGEAQAYQMHPTGARTSPRYMVSPFAMEAAGKAQVPEPPPTDPSHPVPHAASSPGLQPAAESQAESQAAARLAPTGTAQTTPEAGVGEGAKKEAKPASKPRAAGGGASTQITSPTYVVEPDAAVAGGPSHPRGAAPGSAAAPAVAAVVLEEEIIAVEAKRGAESMLPLGTVRTVELREEPARLAAVGAAASAKERPTSPERKGGLFSRMFKRKSGKKEDEARRREKEAAKARKLAEKESLRAEKEFSKGERFTEKAVQDAHHAVEETQKGLAAAQNAEPPRPTSEHANAKLQGSSVFLLQPSFKIKASMLSSYSLSGCKQTACPLKAPRTAALSTEQLTEKEVEGLAAFKCVQGLDGPRA
ncbi:hypothetical protein WJX72_009537 [[Myrmecia] bisecta]|uniref:Uncharacterized protein n=1 Tax=[Myrmecia] bisecta TaxID=41462 RepID=A0AAW1QS91_9CHLO